jgi:hypothetical protein
MHETNKITNIHYPIETEIHTLQSITYSTKSKSRNVDFQPNHVQDQKLNLIGGDPPLDQKPSFDEVALDNYYM